LNNNVKTAFKLRHTEGELTASGEKAYEEDFYIKQSATGPAKNCIFHIFAYGESKWSRLYQQINYKPQNFWSFELVTGGNAVFICEKSHYNIIPGDIYIIRSGSNISVRPGLNGLVKRCILIENQMLNYLCAQELLSDINHIHIANTERITKIYDRIKNLIVSPTDDFQTEELSVMAYALIVELTRQVKPIQYPVPLRKALDIIADRPSEPHTLQTLSEKCNTSISTFSRLFEKYMRTSPMNYIIEQRLEHAKLLIQMNNMTLKEVAERCGYNSESFFSRSFKKKFGVSPATYRKR